MENKYSRLQELQEICKNKKREVNNLYDNIAKSILKRDLKLLTEKHNDIKLIKPTYYKSDFVEYRINGINLTIIDNRRESFLWLFEILPDSKLRLGDAFILNNKPYSVNYIKEIDNKYILPNIENVIQEFDKSIQLLKENPDFTKYKYHYESESTKENKKCSNIFEIYNTVINPKY